jgi:hypothetical protein
MNGSWKATLAVLATLAAAPALAHDHGDHAMGIVEKVAPDRIAIRTADGHVVEFAVTRETRFSQGKAGAAVRDVRVGERAVVHGARAGDGLRAVEVKLPPPAR